MKFTPACLFPASLQLPPSLQHTRETEKVPSGLKKFFFGFLFFGFCSFHHSFV